MQLARNVAKVDLDSTSASVTRNVARKVVPCVRAFTEISLERCQPFFFSEKSNFILNLLLVTGCPKIFKNSDCCTDKSAGEACNK